MCVDVDEFKTMQTYNKNDKYNQNKFASIHSLGDTNRRLSGALVSRGFMGTSIIFKEAMTNLNFNKI